MVLERVSMAAIAEKLAAIGGSGNLAEREWRIRCRLGWHLKSKSAVRHLLYGERRPTIEEVRQIEAGHLKLCAEKIGANARDTHELIETMRAALAAMEASDPDFYRPHIEAVRDMLFRGGDKPGEDGGKN